jgi:hypothetical protein
VCGSLEPPRLDPAETKGTLGYDDPIEKALLVKR